MNQHLRPPALSFLTLVLTVAAFLSPGGPARAAGLGDAEVRVEATQPVYGVADAVVVHVTITNPNTTDLRVLRWQTPVDGLQGPLFQVTRDGEAVPYLGVLVKRPAPTEDDYLVIAPGGTLEADVDLSASWSFAAGGRYEVRYETSSQQLYSTGSAKRAAGSLASPPAGLQVEGRPDPVRKRAVADLVTGSTSFVSCSAGQQSALLTARDDASVYSSGAVDYFADNRSGSRYTKWFGTYLSSRWTTVEAHYGNIASAMDTQPMAFDCTCTDSSYAYVYPSDAYTIYLCSAFWGAPATGTDSKAGTLIHETSHFTVVAGTDDHAYGQSAAQSLAISNPNLAVANADSHEYFAENTPATADSAAAYTLAPPAHDFGAQVLSTTSAAQQFVLTSSGDVPLVLGTLAPTGDYAVSSDTCSGQSLAPAATCTFEVTFTPTATGFQAGSVTIPDNAGVAAEPALYGTGESIACGDFNVDPGEQCDDGNLDPGDGCSPACTIEPCTSAPRPVCNDAASAKLSVSEKVPGKEKLKLSWKMFADATTAGGFGDPVTGDTSVSVCVYDGAGALAGSLFVDRGSETCGGLPCWAAKGTSGFAYADASGTSDGVTKAAFASGAAGSGKASVLGMNNAAKGLASLPTGIVAALSGSSSAVMQMVTSDGLCIGATAAFVKVDDGLRFIAVK